MSKKLLGIVGAVASGVVLMCPVPAVATIGGAAVDRVAPTAGTTSVTFADPIGDHSLIDGLPNDPRSHSIDIRSVRIQKVAGALRVTTTMRTVGVKDGHQYLVASATTPSGLRFLIQASTNSSAAYVAKQSWANEVSCSRARSNEGYGSPGTITAVIPLSCLGRPRQLSRFTAYTFVEVYSVGYSRYLDFAEDEAAGGGVLRLR